MSSIEKIELDGYTVATVKTSSSVYQFSSLEGIADELEKGFIILWQHHGVFAGEIENKQITWLYENNEGPKVYDKDQEEHVLRVRAFDENKEYHIWRSSQGLKARLRDDTAGEETRQYVETSMVLRGVIAKPLKTLEKYNNNKTLFIKTRNYIHYNEIGQAGYVDSRFVRID